MRRNLYILCEAPDENGARRIEAWVAAASRAALCAIVLDARTCDFAALPKLGASDAVLRVTRGAIELETMLLNPQVRSPYLNPALLFNTQLSSLPGALLHQALGLLGPRTIPILTRDRNRLDAALAAVGGLPAVLKVGGGTLGVGTMIVDSIPGYYSVVDHLLGSGHRPVIRSYIRGTSTRLIVCGDRVIDAIAYGPMLNDFRSNSVVSKISTTPFSPTDLAIHQATSAVRSLGLAVGAVDLIIDDTETPHILEVNFPFGLLGIRVEHVTNLVVRHLTST